MTRVPTCLPFSQGLGLLPRRRLSGEGISYLLGSYIFCTYYYPGARTRNKGGRYLLRAHSLRKYFRTQLASPGTIPTDYIEYMMGHTTSTYNNIQMKGVEFIRNLYASSGLSIRPKTQMNKAEILKTMATTLGLDPDKVLSKEALSGPHRTVLDPLSHEENQITALNQAIKNAIIKELRQ